MHVGGSEKKCLWVGLHVRIASLSLLKQRSRMSRCVIKKVTSIVHQYIVNSFTLQCSSLPRNSAVSRPPTYPNYITFYHFCLCTHSLMGEGINLKQLYVPMYCFQPCPLTLKKASWQTMNCIGHCRMIEQFHIHP